MLHYIALQLESQKKVQNYVGTLKNEKVAAWGGALSHNRTSSESNPMALPLHYG
jgi:hypothetical protein